MTCSEDGSIRVWGQPPQDNKDAVGRELLAMSPMERFTGKRYGQGGGGKGRGAGKGR